VGAKRTQKFEIVEGSRVSRIRNRLGSWIWRESYSSSILRDGKIHVELDAGCARQENSRRQVDGCSMIVNAG